MKTLLKATRLTFVLAFLTTTLQAQQIKEGGFYYIVTAGNGPGYSGGPYNYELKGAMYNAENIVKWDEFDPSEQKHIYQFKADPQHAGSWFIKNIVDNTYIGTNSETGTPYNGGIYMGTVSTTPKPEYSYTLTEISQDKYFITETGNKYALSMDNSHNGSPYPSGNLCVWGSITSAQKYGINVWYIREVSQEIIDKLQVRPDSSDIIDNPDTIIIIGDESLGGTLMSSREFSSSTYSAKNAFDHNLSTSFKAATQNMGWIGLDLGTPHVITKIGYAPSYNQGDKMMLGLFEGANQSDFSDAIPFYIIKTEPESQKMTYAEIDCSRGFRYVRYVGPEQYKSNLQATYTYCELAELQFFGQEGEGDDTHLYQATNLPLVVFRTQKEMADLAPNQKTIYQPGRVSFISHDGEKFYTDSMNVKGRGNGSWSLVQSNNAKRPYKLKLANKKKILDFPAKAKKWVFIANWGDKTILRNNLAFKLSEIFEMEFTPAIRMVDVVFNGQYKGNYQLCDQVEVRKNRVDVTEMTPDDNQGEELTGGYLIELDYYASGEPKNFRSATYNIPVTIHYPEPEDITPEQFQYIQNEFNTLCDRVNRNMSIDPQSHYSAKLDIDTWLKYFLIEELAGNPDAYFQLFLSRTRGYNAKFRVSPVWDFDLAFDNDGRFHSIINNNYLSYSSSTYSAGSLKTMNRKIVEDNSQRLMDLWSWYRYEEGLNIDNLHTIIDSLYEHNRQSAELNYQRWQILNTRTQQQYTTRGSYQAEVDYLYQYLADRLLWMDNKVGLHKPTGLHSTLDDTQATGGIHPGYGHILLRGFSEGSTLTIHTLDGQHLQTTTIQGFDNQINLSKGIYIIRVTEQSGKTTTRKIAVK